MIYEIKRGNTVVWSGKAIGAQYRKIMQEDRVEVEINSPSTLAFKKGDSIVVYGRTYKINRPTNITKKNTQVGYVYNIEFEALYYDLGKWGLFTLDKNNNLTERNVYLMSDAKTLLGLALQNANRASSGWSLGVIDDTEVFQWSFSSAKILSALQEVADKTGLELWFDDKTINLTRRQPNTGLKLEYGKGNELYELYRTRRDNPVVTHLYITGGSRNIPNNYGYSNIQPTGGNPLVNPNYSPGDDIVEDFHVYDNIYPRLNASITTVISENVIRSSDIDFDLNDHLLDNGLPAQIVFTSGQLVGFTFTISENGYNHATRQVTFNKIVDDPAYPDGVPSNLLKPAVGDSFVFLQIDMPQVYVTGSENKVLDIGNSYFADNGIEQYNWSCKPIPRFLLEQEVELILGGIVNLKATDIGYNGNIRIDSYVRDLQKAHRYEFTLSNIIGISEFARERNKSDKIADTVTRNLGDGGLQINTTYAEKAGYAERAGRADIATHAATADTAGHANTADLATHSLTAGHANTSDLATRALRADLSDNSILWNGLAQPNYLTQPVRPGDSPKFEGVSSPAFQSGWSGNGYRIVKDANDKYVLEVDDLFVRGEANFYSLVVNELKSTNGAIIVSDGIEITGVTKTGSNYVCSFDTDDGAVGNPFRFDDVVKCQVWNGQGAKLFVGRVLSTTSSSFTLSILQGSSIPSEGDHIVRIDNFTDNNRKGIVYITASDSGAPFIDTVYGMWTDRANSVRTRMGNLAGIVSPIFGTLADFGFYGKRAYLEEAHVHGTLIATSGSNVYNKSETQAEISNAEGRINLQVTNKIDAIQIGGRNLLRNYTFNNGFTSWSIASAYRSILAPEPDKPNSSILQLSFNSDVLLASPYYNTTRNLVDTSSRYTISFDFFCQNLNEWDGTAAMTIRTFEAITGGSATGVLTVNKSNMIAQGLVSGKWFRVSMTTPNEVTEGLFITASVYVSGTKGTYRYRDIQLEKGDKATDPQPAIEDIENNINAVQSSVTNLAIKVDANTQSITSKAERAEVNALGTRVSTAEEKITPDAINFTVSSQIDTKIEGIEVGSSNLLGDSNFSIGYGQPNWASVNGTRSKVSDGYRHSVTGSASRMQSTISLDKGDYVISARVKSVGGGFRFGQFEGVANAEYGSHNAPASDFVIIKATFSVQNDNTNVILRLYSNGTTSGYNLTANWIVLLSGNKGAMAWTPSFSDYSTTEATKTSFNMTDNNISLLGQTINLTGLITFQGTNAQNAANAAQGTANTANTKATNAQSAADAANTAALDAAGIANGKGKVIYAASAPTSSIDRNANNLWIRTSDNKPHRWTGSAWSAVTDKVATDAAAAANTANNNLASLQGSLKSMAYEDKVNLAKLDNSIVEGGYFKTTLIDVQDVFAQTVTATNLTISGTSNFGGFRAIGSYLANDNNTTELGGIRISNLNSNRQVGLGQAFSSATGIKTLGWFEDKTPNVSTKDGVEIKVTGATVTNRALRITASGGIENLALEITSGKIRIGGEDGLSRVMSVMAESIGATSWYDHYKFKEGVLIKHIRNTSPNPPIGF